MKTTKRRKTMQSPRKLRLIQTAMLLALTVILPLTASAQVTYWTGNNNDGEYDFLAPGNWSDGLPSAEVGFVISNGSTVVLGEGLISAAAGSLDGSALVVNGGQLSTILNGVNDSTLTVTGNGYLNGGAYIGEGGNNIVTVSGSGRVDGFFYAYGDNNRYIVTDNGVVNHTQFIAVDGAYQTLLINGGQWNNSGEISAGGSAVGALTVTGSGYLNNVGYESHITNNTSNGVVVSGNGRWDTDALTVGYDSGAAYGIFGQLLITDDAVLNSSTSTLGYGSNGTVTVSGNGQWNVNGDLRLGVNGGVTLNLDGGTVRVSGSVHFGGVLEGGYDYGGVGAVVIGGDGSGRLLNADGSTPASIGAIGYSSGTVQFTHSGTIDFANVISSSTNISIEQNGPGSTTLTANSSIKDLSVSGGKLNVSGTLTLQGGQSTVTGGELNVIAGGHLRGLGDIDGLLTVKAGGVLATTLTFSNGLTLETGAILDFDGNLLVTGGFITIADGILVDFSGLTETGSYVVIDWSGASGSVNANSFSATGLDEGLQGSFSVANNQLTFNATAVPEPSIYALLAVGFGILVFLRFRRRKIQA
jgi:hypothetical protein